MLKQATKLGMLSILTLFFSSCERASELSRATTLHQTGVKHYENSDFHLAISPLKEALAVRKEHLGLTDDRTISTGQFLLTCLNGNGDDEAAVEIGTEYLRKIKALEGSNTLPYARIETFVGLAQADLGFFNDAIEALRHAKSVYLEQLGEDSEDTLLAMHNLNLTLSRAGYIDEAVAEEKKLLDMKRSILGSEHRETIKSITNLAFALSKQDEHDQARKLHEESLELRKKVFGRTHPETFIGAINLGVAYSRVDQLEDGIMLCREGYQFFVEYYPAGHPDIRWAALNLRNLLSYTDQIEEKENLTATYNLE